MDMRTAWFSFAMISRLDVEQLGGRTSNYTMALYNTREDLMKLLGVGRM
jgi:hypothetical protein